MTFRIYTKTGDKGETGLYGGTRVKKDSIRVETYGTVDELNATLGMARAMKPHAKIDPLLATLQNLLFELGAELATPADKKKRPNGVKAADITLMEQAIDKAEEELAPLKTFILPGGHPVAAALHQARGVCRRAERLCVTLRDQEPDTSENTVIFLNRLSDLLFVYARYANHLAGTPDVAWEARSA